MRSPPTHRRRAGLGAALAVLLLMLSPAAGARFRGRPLAHRPAPCPDAGAPASRTSADVLRRAVVCLVNQERRAFGLPRLRQSRRLDTAAQEWTNTMIATGDFSHGDDFAGRISSVGFAFSAAGENIASGFATPRQVVRGWMASAGHCANILDPTYSRAGVGVVPQPMPGIGRGATWTEDFALPAGARAPSRDDAPMDGCPY